MNDKGVIRLNEATIQAAIETGLRDVSPAPGLLSLRRERMKARNTYGVRLPVISRLSISFAVVAIAVLFAVWQPWSYLTDERTPVTAILEAYGDMTKLETVKYRVTHDTSPGVNWVEEVQVDLIDRTLYSSYYLPPPIGVPGGIQTRRQEAVEVNGTRFRRDAPKEFMGTSYPAGEWRAVTKYDVSTWNPFGELGGMPWGGPDVFGERFASVERLPDEEIQGVPVERYKASREIVGDNAARFSEELEVWVRRDNRLLLKAEIVSIRGYMPSTNVGVDGRTAHSIYEFTEFNVPLKMPEPMPGL